MEVCLDPLNSSYHMYLWLGFLGLWTMKDVDGFPPQVSITSWRTYLCIVFVMC